MKEPERRTTDRRRNILNNNIFALKLLLFEFEGELRLYCIVKNVGKTGPPLAPSTRLDFNFMTDHTDWREGLKKENHYVS